MSGVGDREWNTEYRERERAHDPVERARWRLIAAKLRGELTNDEVETMCRIIGRPSRLPTYQRPVWTRW